MAPSEREKMQAGDWYTCIDAELDELRAVAAEAVFEHNTLPPEKRRDLGPKLAALLGTSGSDCRIEAPFHCPYGFNIHLGSPVFLNAGCVILDTAPVEIGDRTMLGPAVQIYCAEHHKDAVKRAAGLEIAKPVSIGQDVWIGGAAVILGGVTIGDRAIIGAGSVVTTDVAPDSLVAGNPAKTVGTSRSSKR